MKKRGSKPTARKSKCRQCALDVAITGRWNQFDNKDAMQNRKKIAKRAS